MKKLNEVHDLIKLSDFSTKIKIYFSSKSFGTDYDPESKNYTVTYKNPITIKGLVRHISAESSVWKVYGQATEGAVECIVEKKYKDNFKNCAKVEIDSVTYNVFRDKIGSNASIIERPNNLLRISLQRA